MDESNEVRSTDSTHWCTPTDPWDPKGKHVKKGAFHVDITLVKQEGYKTYWKCDGCGTEWCHDAEHDLPPDHPAEVRRRDLVKSILGEEVYCQIHGDNLDSQN